MPSKLPDFNECNKKKIHMSFITIGLFLYTNKGKINIRTVKIKPVIPSSKKASKKILWGNSFLSIPLYIIPKLPMPCPKKNEAKESKILSKVNDKYSNLDITDLSCP